METAVERMLEMEKVLEDGMHCLKKRKMEKGRRMEAGEDLPEVFTFHVTLTHSATFYQWRDIGATQQLATDEDIACFLMECYDKGRKDSPPGSATCTKCQAPLNLLCALCDADSTLTSKCPQGRSSDNISFREASSTPPQQYSREVRGDTEPHNSRLTKSKLETTRRRNSPGENAAQDAITVKLEADETSPTEPASPATTRQPESSSSRATRSATTLATTPVSGDSGRQPRSLSSAREIPSPGSEDDSPGNGNQGVVVDDEDVELFHREAEDRSFSASEVECGAGDGPGGGEEERKRHPRTRRGGVGPAGLTSSRDLVCSVCGRAMASKRSLLYHMGSQHPEAVLPACIAHLSSARKGEDEAVRQARVEKVKARLKRRAELESLTCGTCGKKFENKLKMSSHLKQCTWKVCDLCGKSVKDLDMHLKRHVAPKRFQCPHCPKVYLFKTYLDTHLLYHNRERPFCCEVCGARYYEKFRLTAHIRTHTGVKPFTCAQCEARFTRKRGLSDHMRVHTGEKPYACQVCGRQFSSTGNLAAHRRKVHKMEPQVAQPTRSVVLNASAAATTTTTTTPTTTTTTNNTTDNDANTNDADTNAETVFGTVTETETGKSEFRNGARDWDPTEAGSRSQNWNSDRNQNQH